METESKVQSRPFDLPLSLSRNCKQLQRIFPPVGRLNDSDD